MKQSIPFPACFATLAFLNLSAHADIVFQASDTNTTPVSNLNGGTDTLDKVAITGDTAAGTLLVSNTNGNFNNAGITSTDTIATLNGSAVAATSVVTMTLTIDDITGGFRANGVAFGLTADNTTFGDATDLRVQLRANDEAAELISGFGTPDPFTAWGATEASIRDGFTVTLVADIKGYTFSFSDLIAINENPVVDITGTFSGNEFLDNFGPGFLYQPPKNSTSGPPPLTPRSVKQVSTSSPSQMRTMTAFPIASRMRPQGSIEILPETLTKVPTMDSSTTTGAPTFRSS